MPIRLLLEDERYYFGPDEIRNLFDAFEATLTKLGLKKDREDIRCWSPERSSTRPSEASAIRYGSAKRRSRRYLGRGAIFNKYASPDRRFKPGQSRRLSSLRRVSVSPRSSE